MPAPTLSLPDALADRRLDLLANQAPPWLMAVLRGVGTTDFAARWPGVVDDVAGVFLSTQVASLAVVEDCLGEMVGGSVTIEPAAYVGRVGSRSLADFLAITPTAWAARIAQGATPAQAVVAQAQYLAGSVATEVHVVARDATIDTAGADPRFEGWARVAEAGACAFCLMLATRGAVYSSEQVAAGKKYHRHCRCVARAKPRGAGSTPWAGTGARQQQQRDDFDRAHRAVVCGAGTPERAAFIRRQIGILTRLDNEWARGELAALHAELAAI